MGFIIFVAVVILAIYLIKKSSSDKNSSFEEPVKSQISFDNLSQRRRFLLLSAQNMSWTKYELHKDDVEKYALPSLSR